jgi:hypothetical protein
MRVPATRFAKHEKLLNADALSQGTTQPGDWFLGELRKICPPTRQNRARRGGPRQLAALPRSGMTVAIRFIEQSI